MHPSASSHPTSRLEAELLLGSVRRLYIISIGIPLDVLRRTPDIPLRVGIIEFSYLNKKSGWFTSRRFEEKKKNLGRQRVNL